MNTVERHPLIGRRVRVAGHSQHYPNRVGVITDWLGFDTVMVSLDPYKRAPPRRQTYWLTDIVVQPPAAPNQPNQGNRHEQEARSHA